MECNNQYPILPGISLARRSFTQEVEIPNTGDQLIHDLAFRPSVQGIGYQSS